jgi:vancomycin aglycone glucosyltransferase
MRVLLSTIGSRGDVQPLVALAVRLRELGHQARLVAPPDFREWVEGLGFEVTPVGPWLRESTAGRNAERPAPEALRQLVTDSVADQFAAVSAAAKGCDVIVAASALQAAARTVAEVDGLPYVFVAYSANVLPSAHHAPPSVPPPADRAAVPGLWAQDAARFDATFAAALNEHRAAAGLAPVTGVRDHILTAAPWLAADPVLSQWRAAEPVFQPGALVLPDDRPLSTELTAFLDAGEPPVYFGFGSIRAPEGLSEAMIAAARALGRRAIVSRGWADLSLVDDAPDCLAIGEVNQQALFGRCAAVVHHGGAGTTTAAALAGAPQVLVPQLYDQYYWASRVADLGIGGAHAPGAPSAESLTAALGPVLDPAVARRAREVAATVRWDGASVAAARLLAG